MIIRFILIIVLICVVYYFYKNKIRIKIKTFFKRGFKINNKPFGIYVYVAPQGNGKTYSCTEYIIDNYKDLIVFSNITFFNIDYIHFYGFKEMLELRDLIDKAKKNNEDFLIWKNKKYPIDWSKQIVFVYDEIFSELQRGSKISNDVLDFITQMRKRHFILLTTAQIWSDIPITWRRLTRFQIDCKLLHFFGLNILIKVFHDAEQMKWSNEDQDFVAPIISTTISHTRKFIANSYDTFEVIHNKFSSIAPKEHIEEKNVNIDYTFWNDLKFDEVIYEDEKKD